MTNNSVAGQANLKEAKRHCSPATMTSREKMTVYGNPFADYICTPHVEMDQLIPNNGYRLIPA